MQVKREKNKCFVKAKICPEHKIRGKLYMLTVTINEVKQEIEDAHCLSCAAAQDGCKHVAALLKWLNCRTEEPACTPVEAYWVKPKIARVGKEDKFLELTEIIKSSPQSQLNDENKNASSSFQPEEFVKNILESGRQAYSKSHLIKHLSPPSVLDLCSIYHLGLTYSGDRKNINSFLQHCASFLTSENLKYIEKATQERSKNHLWYELRYARITASKLYDVAQWKTERGSLFNVLMGGKIRDTFAMKRGRDLEDSVIDTVRSTIISPIQKSGLFLSSDFPVFGASPDGVGETFVVEVKCPTNEKSFKNYCNRGKITAKYKAQIQMQMFFAKKKLGYFCVADHNFKENNKVTIIKENFDFNYINSVMHKAMIF